MAATQVPSTRGGFLIGDGHTYLGGPRRPPPRPQARPGMVRIYRRRAATGTGTAATKGKPLALSPDRAAARRDAPRTDRSPTTDAASDWGLPLPGADRAATPGGLR